MLQTVLLGDAAHTMTPALGQGLNCGLEDVVVFAQCLKDFDSDLDAALPAYTKARLPDIQAIMTINEVVATSDVGLASQVRLAVEAQRDQAALHIIKLGQCCKYPASTQSDSVADTMSGCGLFTCRHSISDVQPFATGLCL